MKKNLANFRHQSIVELKTLVQKLRTEGLKSQAISAMEKNKDNQAAMKKRKEIARLLTLIKEKELVTA